MAHRNQVGHAIATGIVLLSVVSFDARARDSVKIAGDVLQVVMPAVAAGMTIGYRDRKGTLQFGESAALTLGVTYTLKHTIDARRPNGGSQSFPSGHAAIAFSSAEFIRNRYGVEYGLPAYAVASFVAYSRVEARRHYPRDVTAGAALGVVSSYVFTTHYKGWAIEPQADAGCYGVRLVKSW